MEEPVMNITLSGIGWWTTEAVVRSVVETWGEVKEMSRGKTEFQGHSISTDKWMVKVVKKKEITIPPVVVHAGSDRSSEERELWKVFYRGVIKVCYRCLKEGHLGRDCKETSPVTIEYLASQAEYEGAPAAPSNAEVISGERRTFAQIVKDNSFVETRLARQRLADKLRQEKADMVRQEREKRDEMRKQRRDERKRREGFSINKSGEDSEFSDSDIGEEKDNKRPRISPEHAGPESKTNKLCSGGDQNVRRDIRGGPPGN
eukprot:GFUD01016543.1.p1 GENE.GFUD01016543.1~~GFUD01016543.1.p1  ORF type:complete len:260 (+),score=89.37 GFUD01016543.1:95-874(+)